MVGRRASTESRVGFGPGKSKTRLRLKAISPKSYDPSNAAKEPVTEMSLFGYFVRSVVFPFCRRKWKKSTRCTTEDRIPFYLTGPLEKRPIGSFERDELQSLLDMKAKAGLSFSTVAHLRWDLHQVFDFAVAEGAIRRNPAELLFTPKGCTTSPTRSLNVKDVKKLDGYPLHSG